jgi:sugar phosphate isomerase/epimerase
MKVRDHDIGVCSWSIKPTDTADLVSAVRSIGLEHLQLALVPLLNRSGDERAADIRILRDSGLTITATMIDFPGDDYSSIATIRRTGGLVPDDVWSQRKEMTLRAGQLTAELGIKLLSFHFGFVPTSSDPFYNVMVERARELAQGVAGDGVSLLAETGQESASELLQFLNDTNCRNVGVNFDPANMILYGAGDPIDAIEILDRHIKHVHVKDAIASSKPRVEWGKEVPFGAGEVGAEMFLDALDQIGYEGPLCIEREVGDDRVAAIQAAILALRDAE